jgi:2-C-methyl-D-erythritol 4-phosphate cytidylyltransferase/2-C-methyl-D-erythritol 2,4-cyclodiphosphate synthase
VSSSADFAAIIPAAGRGTRFGGEKLSQVVVGRSVLEHSLCAFLEREDVAVVIVATGDTAAPLPISQEIARHGKLHVCAGGRHRSESVRAGLEVLGSGPGAIEFLTIHDAARPAVSQELIDRVLAAARKHGAAVPGLPVIDTIKRVQDGVIVETLRRPELFAVQTPQAMRRQWLVDALDRCPLPADQVTDDVQVLELAGRRVHLVPGDADNVKVTHPQDLSRVASVLARQAGSERAAG